MIATGMRRVIEAIGGAYELARLAVLTRFDFHGPYWTWRMHTAFGAERLPRRELARSVLAYSRWVYRQRRGG